VKFEKNNCAESTPFNRNARPCVAGRAPTGRASASSHHHHGGGLVAAPAAAAAAALLEREGAHDHGLHLYIAIDVRRQGDRILLWHIPLSLFDGPRHGAHHYPRWRDNLWLLLELLRRLLNNLVAVRHVPEGRSGSELPRLGHAKRCIGHMLQGDQPGDVCGDGHLRGLPGYRRVVFLQQGQLLRRGLGRDQRNVHGQDLRHKRSAEPLRCAQHPPVWNDLVTHVPIRPCGGRLRRQLSESPSPDRQR
jgi:hypothetical protein